MNHYHIIRHKDGRHIGEVELSSEEFEDYLARIHNEGTPTYRMFADAIGATKVILYEGGSDQDDIALFRQFRTKSHPHTDCAISV